MAPEHLWELLQGCRVAGLQGFVGVYSKITKRAIEKYNNILPPIDSWANKFICKTTSY